MSQTSQSYFRDLGPFSDFVDAARALHPLFPVARPGGATRMRAREVLRFTVDDEQPKSALEERTWQVDGIHGAEISWSVGYGPRTHAWVLKPVGAHAPLPGIVALHDHGHNKFFGKEKIADGPEGSLDAVRDFRTTYYGGRGYADVLAREGFLVLVHDTFLWGSRRFPFEVMPQIERNLAERIGAVLGPAASIPDVARYNGAAYLHEHLISKYCTLLGTNLAAVVAYEDRVALNYLRARQDVDPERVACVGLSGGGLRAALLSATSDHLRARVIVGMMSTYEGLIDSCVAPHTWMLFPDGWSVHGDWPDLAASAAPTPLLVQYLLEDAQFTVDGMRGADARIAAHYAAVGAAADEYRGEFYPGPHRFDVPMQQAAISWLLSKLRR